MKTFQRKGQSHNDVVKMQSGESFKPQIIYRDALSFSVFHHVQGIQNNVSKNTKFKIFKLTCF